MSPLSVVTLNVAWAAALSSTGSAKVMIDRGRDADRGAARDLEEARMVLSGLMVASVPVNGDSTPSASTAMPLKV